jgi:phage terminase large subunit GpA-like protein
MISNGTKLVRDSIARALMPPQQITVSEWSDRYRMLSSAASAEHGPWRTRRTPYLSEVMDALSPNSPVQFVTFMAGAQLGKTECLNNLIGYTIHQAPGPMMAVQPTVDLAKVMSRQRLEPLIADSPVLRRLIGGTKSRDSTNTVLHKDFPGGFLRLVGANSSAGLRSMPVRILALDEIDAYPGDVDGEGDPVALAEARTRTYAGRKKVVKTSTPTIEGRSRISKSYDEGDRSRFHLPCPECGELEVLAWRDIKYDRDEDGDLVLDTVRWACPACGSLVAEHHKTAMLEGGVWIAEAPDLSHRHRSFHISSLYSPVGWYSWEDAVRDFILASKPGETEALRAFVNTVLGETWKEKGEAPEWERLYNRRETYELGVVPAGVSILTVGVDVQADRLEFEVVGWGDNFESWSVDYRVIMGRPDEDKTWEELERAIGSGYPLAGSDVRVPIAKVAVDTGYATQSVYTWIRRQRADQVLAIKGGPDSYPMLVGTPKKVETTEKGRRLRRGLQLWTVGTGVAKAELYAWLRAEQPTNPEKTGFPRGWSHFPQYEEEHFKQLCAEVLVVRIKRSAGARRETGRRYVWEKTRERNERVDCRVYARAAAYVAGVDRWSSEDWATQAELLAGGGRSSAPPRRRRERSGWMTRHQRD